MAEDSLKEKTIKGVGWTALDSFLRYGVTFVVSIILARLLSPDDYGLIGILTVYIAFFDIIIDGGFINALIRKQNTEEIDYSTVFYTNLVLSLVMAGVIYFSSETIADFFGRKELVLLTQVMSLIVIINALGLVPKARLTKAINFKTQTKASFTAAVVSGIIGVVMAYSGYGVWSLVWQQLCNAFLCTIIFWVANQWIPKFQFSITSFKEMWSFGWKLLLSGIFNSISGQLYHLIIGKKFLPSTLGQYTRAYQFGSIFSNNLTTIVQRVSFPVLSEIQDDSVRMKSAYRRVIKVTVFPTFILMMLLAATAKPLLLVLIGEKWVEAAYLLQIITFSMMLYPLHSLNLNAIQVMGRSDLTLRINIIKNLLIVIPIVVGILTNVYWMLITDVARSCFCYYLNAYYSKMVINYPILEQLKDIAPSLIIAITIAFPVYLLSFVELQPIVVLLLQVGIGIMIGRQVLEKTNTFEYKELKSLAIAAIKKI